ncbi:hypothetical protein [Streptococcus halichoeri]|uniref:hypothetical protein n=1 Tax=Streptococcus halichoeri TaxID=254785 RepID=UPI00135A1835|nr:hypothetical protein [Streptococcus halichoeri]
MLQDEFKQISLVTLPGNSSEDKVIAIPKAVFNLPPEEKAKALKELEEDMEHYRRKGGDST